MPGGLPVVPVYDLKIKGTDLVAGTHGRSFWILDDISPLRALADGNAGTRLIAPRTDGADETAFRRTGGRAHPATRSRSPSASVAASRPSSSRMAPGCGSISTVGENPPNGAIVYYWLDEAASGPVTLTFRDAAGVDIVTLRSDDDSLPAVRRPGTRRGLNRFVWDMRHPGPVRIDPSWTILKKKPLANEPEAQAGPTVVPGEYRVALTVGSETQTVGFPIVKDPARSDFGGGLCEPVRPAQAALRQALHAECSSQSDSPRA